MTSWRSLVFTMQEGDLGLRPSCCQDGTLVPFSLMTNPAGLSLIISTHKQHAHSPTHKYAEIHIWSYGLQGPCGKRDWRTGQTSSLWEKKTHCATLYWVFFCIDRSICILRGVPRKVQKQWSKVQVLWNVEKGCFPSSVFNGESLKDSIREPVVHLAS